MWFSSLSKHSSLCHRSSILGQAGCQERLICGNPLERIISPKIPGKRVWCKTEAPALPANSHLSPLEHPGAESWLRSWKSSPQIVLCIPKNTRQPQHGCCLRCEIRDSSVPTTNQRHEHEPSARVTSGRRVFRGGRTLSHRDRQGHIRATNNPQEQPSEFPASHLRSRGSF